MLFNYLKISWRNFLQNKLYSCINIAGLAIGLTCVMVIGVYVNSELSFDQQQPLAERTWRFSKHYLGSGDPVVFAGNDARVGPLLMESIPEIENFLRIFRASLPVRLDETVNVEPGIHFADPSLAAFFKLDWQQGDPHSALAEPGSIVLTNSLAKKYFSDDDPMGQTLLLDEAFSVEVTGIISDLPANTHLSGNAFVSMGTRGSLLESDMQSWSGFNYHTYLRLTEGVDYSNLEPVLIDTLNSHKPQEMHQYWDYSGLNIRDIHLRSRSPIFELGSPGNFNEILILGATALTLLAIGCINFINLTTARLYQRFPELSVRKAIGASYRQQLQQLLLESGLMALSALLISLPLMELAMPAISGLTGITVDLNATAARTLLLIIAIALPCIAALLACASSLFLRSMAKRTGTGGKLGHGDRSAGRNLLVVMQFSAAIILLIAISVVYLQVQHSKQLYPGFNKDNVIVIEFLRNNDGEFSWDTFKNRLLENSSITHVTASGVRPFMDFTSTSRVRLQGEQQETIMSRTMVDPDFFETYQIRLLSGRSFSDNRSSDRIIFPDQQTPHTAAGLIINESALSLFGTDAQGVLGSSIEVGYANDFSISVQGTVVGVVGDMHLESTQHAIEPMFFMLAGPATVLPSASVKVLGDDLEGVLDYVRGVVAESFPGEFIDVFPLEQSFRTLYRAEENFAQLLTFFTVLVIGISCLGLLGLSAYLIDLRTKEIGIRKVMGSSVWGIVLLLTKDFSRLIVIANIIAWPVAYILMTRWLESFPYRIDPEPLLFVGCGLLTLSISWLTISGKATRAAMAKPVLALKYE